MPAALKPSGVTDPRPRPAPGHAVRLVALDVETAEWGHVVELGCVEIVGGAIGSRQFHTHIRPTVRVNPFAYQVHGLSDAFLRDKPWFSDIAAGFLAFIGDARLVSHKESAERCNLSAEMERLGLPPLERNRFVCTLEMAKARGGFTSHKLRAVCDCLGISVRHLPDRHDALTDAILAAEAYLRMTAKSRAA
jgi:DNA polymerase-3 subunit epsilon